MPQEDVNNTLPQELNHVLQKHPVVLFDGVCNYCNTMVNFAIRWNNKKNLRFTPLQSHTGKIINNAFKVPANIDSLVLVYNNKTYFYSTAALIICKFLDYPIKLLYVFIIIPPILRNKLYKWFAANRYKWFGKKDTCIIPSKEVKNLFLS